MTTTGELVKPDNGTREVAMALPPGVSQQDSLITGFDGMATVPFAKEVIAALTGPIDPEQVEIKPDGIVYLPGVWYRQRLMQAFGPGGWAIAPRRPPQTRSSGGGELVVYYGALYALGRYVSEAGGQCVYWPKNAGMTYADALEGAKTDCITRCCKDLGIAHELWDPGWRTQWQDKYATSSWDPKKEKYTWKRKGREQKMPTGATGTPGPAPRAATPTPAATSAETARPSDDGESPTEAELDELEELVFKKLAWKQGQAGMWLKERFGDNDPSCLTRAQVKTCFSLLLVWGSPVQYKATLALEQQAGRCR